MRTLAELRDIRLPDPAAERLADWLGASPVVIPALLALAIVALIVWRRRGGRRRARADLAAAERDWQARGDFPRLAQALSSLVRRRIATGDLAAVAAAGKRWQRLLEAAGFSAATAEALAILPFQPPEAGGSRSRADGERWIAEVRTWLRATS